LEDITGEAVQAFRAPSFSITRNSLWALDVLRAEDYRVDSSIFPIHHDFYGIPDAEPYPHQREASFGHLWEFPPSVKKLGRLNLPVGGGGYFRMFPYSFTRRFYKEINDRSGQPIVFYIHPWEFDPDQPRIPSASWKSRCRHYLNLHKTEARVDRLLSDFQFGSLGQVLQRLTAADIPVPHLTFGLNDKESIGTNGQGELGSLRAAGDAAASVRSRDS
jgi:polysaccharide deacetylase family protein (PEP-CTERM system associated)